MDLEQNSLLNGTGNFCEGTGNFERKNREFEPSVGAFKIVGDIEQGDVASEFIPSEWVASVTVAPLFELRGISKEFPGVKAHDDVSFEIRAGEVHMLVGENGAGKSTLMKVLCGAYRADRGSFFHDGEPVTINDAAAARGPRRCTSSAPPGSPTMLNTSSGPTR